MKNKRTEKSFSKFKKRSDGARRDRDRAKRELMRLVEETNVGIDSLVIKSAYDKGRAGASFKASRVDETIHTGVFSSSRQGYGFVTVEGLDRDVFIPDVAVHGAIDGDVVEITYRKYTNRFGEEKTEGRVKKILEMGRKNVVGTLDEEIVSFRNRKRGMPRLVLIPDDPKLFECFYVADAGDAAIGDKVEAKIIRGDGVRSHTVSVIRSFGYSYGREANYEAILAESEIPVDFTPAELAEASFFASMPISDTDRVRRDEVIFTIDGAGAKDLDDAVSLRKINGGWRLGVHIADVSHYVSERTHLDRAVMARGTSVYFTDKVVPMLPPALSNGACSLNAGEDKYTLSAIITLDGEGNIKKTVIEPSIINSRVRGVYSEVNEILAGEADAPTRAKYKAVIPTLLRMHELYLILSERSKRRGSLELDSAEAEIILGEDGEPVDIVKRERGVAERIIEEFMICANEAVAKLLSDKEIPCVYRIHEPPPPEKLSDFLTYVHNLGFDTRYVSREKCTPRDLSALLLAAEERGLSKQVSYSMLRSMAKAQYSEVRRDHYGLSLEYYCHFTSPIRRLSDLATHRIIHKVLLEGKRPELYSKYARRAAAAATDAELRAVGAERKIENLYKVIFMSDRIGECFDATINSVTSFGFFAELDNTCEGLVPISERPGMFVFDEKNLTLSYRGKFYRVGDSVRVRLEEADILRGKLRFSVV